MVKKETINLSDGTKITAWVHEAKNKEKNRELIIQLHGYPSDSHGSHKEYAEAISEEGINSLRYDMRGCGESSGGFKELTLTKAYEDLKEIIKWAEQKGYEVTGLLGSSFGGAVAIKTASENKKIKKLILLAPAPDLTDPTEWEPHTTLEEWKKKGYYEMPWEPEGTKKIPYEFYEDAKKHDLYEEAKKITAKTIIIHGDNDKIVPVDQAKKLKEKIKNAKEIILKGAGHDLRINGTKKEAIRIIKENLKEE